MSGLPGPRESAYAATAAPYPGAAVRERIIPPVATAARRRLPRLAGPSPTDTRPMPTSRALVASNDAPRLLRTLSNHWRHKFDVRRDSDTHAHIPFAEAAGADFEVAGDALLIKLVHDDGAGMARLREVVESHLQRFARDETLEFHWQP